MDDRLARHYRNARREPWNGLATTPAQWAMVKARATIKGQQLAGSGDVDREGSRSWEVEIGHGLTVIVRQVPQFGQCDCWDWAKENPRDDGREDDIPEHGHFGIVAECTWHGREVAEDSCWGFVWDWPGQDDDRELTWAWDEIAEPVIESARDILASLPVWVLAQMEAWEEVA